MSTREILTFQFGNYSNYIGAHWWNIQEFGFNYDPLAEPSEINHDIFYREGIDMKGQTTFTPRLLLTDLDGSFQHMPENGELYQEDNFENNFENKSLVDALKNEIQWDPKRIEVITEPSCSRPDFKNDIENTDINLEEKDYDFSKNVSSWTDYLYTRYHPRSLNILKEYKHSNEKESFDTFTNGASFWKTPQFDEEFSDKIRQYVEECSNCQGFQTIFDCSNGFSGLTLKCIEHLNDDYSKTIFSIPVFSPRSILYENTDGPLTDSIRTVNTAITYSQLLDQCSLFVPISLQSRVFRKFGTARGFSHLKYNPENLYETSAILASFLDTVTLRYRMKNMSSSSYLANFCSDVTRYNRKLGAGTFSFPFPIRNDHDLIDCLDTFVGDFFTPISPNCKVGTDYVTQSVCVRGIPKIRLKRPYQQAQNQLRMAAYKCESISEMFQFYFQCQNYASIAHVSSISSPMQIRTSFPRDIFSATMNKEGFLEDFHRHPEQKISSLPSIASVQSSGDIGDTLEVLHREASRIKIAKIHRFKETGLEVDEYAEILENLLLYKDNYDDNFEL